MNQSECARMGWVRRVRASSFLQATAHLHTVHVISRRYIKIFHSFIFFIKISDESISNPVWVNENMSHRVSPFILKIILLTVTNIYVAFLYSNTSAFWEVLKERKFCRIKKKKNSHNILKSRAVAQLTGFLRQISALIPSFMYYFYMHIEERR